MEKTRTIRLEDLSTSQEMDLVGSGDRNLTILSECLQTELSFRDGVFTMHEDSDQKEEQLREVLQALVAAVKKGHAISEQDVIYACRLAVSGQPIDFEDWNRVLVGRTYSGKPIVPKTKGQNAFVKAMERYDIVFAIGPAGTGKTFLAVTEAVTALKKGDVHRIILTRPAVEAGESLGFLPGDLKVKVDPYLTPLYDALHEMLGNEKTETLMEKGIIEIAPLAYMRGRTLDDAFVILDEAQNTTPSQLKMFLTRLGFHSKMVITGDITQIDLKPGMTSGLIDASLVLKDMDEIAIMHLTSDDVVRHPLVQKILERYEKYEKKN